MGIYVIGITESIRAQEYPAIVSCVLATTRRPLTYVTLGQWFAYF